MSIRTSCAMAAIGLAMVLAGTMAGCPLVSSLLEPFCPDPNCPEPNCPEPNCPEPNAVEPNAPEKPLHERIFTEILSDPDFDGIGTCVSCHAGAALDILETGHWNWAGTAVNIEGYEDEIHGKIDLLNNY